MRVLKYYVENKAQLETNKMYLCRLRSSTHNLFGTPTVTTPAMTTIVNNIKNTNDDNELHVFTNKSTVPA